MVTYTKLRDGSWGVDPDKALEMVRERGRELLRQVDSEEQIDRDALGAYIETVQGLDDWMSKGGFALRKWDR